MVTQTGKPADGSILHVEFQSTAQPDDLKRFYQYAVAVYLQHERPVHTVVFYGPGISSAVDRLEAGSLSYRVHSVLVGQEDGTGQLHALYAKVQRGDALSEDDRATLLLLPLMRQREPLPGMLAELKAVASVLPLEERTLTVGALIALAWCYVDEEWATELMEVLNMPNVLTSMLDDALTRGLEQGLEQGRREALRLLIRSRFGSVPDEVERRIAAAQGDALDALIAQAATVPTLEELSG